MAAEDNFRRIRAALNARRKRNTLLGIYTTRVYVVKRVWEGGRRSAEGGFTDYGIYQGQVINQANGIGFTWSGAGMEISPRPKCRMLSSREIYNSAGIYHEGDVRVTYIQPYWKDRNGVQKGYAPVDIAPESTDDGVEYFYRLQASDQSGGITGDYYLIGSILEKWGHYQVTLTARGNTPGKL